MPTTIELPAHTLRLAEERAAQRGVSVPEFVSTLIETSLENEVAAPYRPLIPNAETIAAMQEADAGGLPSFTSLESLKAYLNSPD